MKIIFKGHIYESVMLESITFSFNVADTNNDELDRINKMYEDYIAYAHSENADPIKSDELEDQWYNEYMKYSNSNESKNPTVNFTNRNAKVLLDLLGIGGEEKDLYGRDKIDDFIKRIDNAYELIHTQVIPPTDSLANKDNGDTSTDARWVDNGLSEEDIKDKLDRLKATAIKGKELGHHTISWG